ncbi:MAG: STAS domain-containing protein [Desulfomonilia bacterium]|jgi:anti-anti-sigma factor|uniref:Putative Anti-sigma factor antagonist n=1 Tax=anaerobic digester metagenome TaxID=1263854 RepID=A0A485M4D2_9ZZZZ|nr:STAS domain-containing protein [Pseudomonadota bacterium]HON38838.1 STAS domain-containing protein [Deltaproteobacteria bacterium]HRS56851.1 STAS domain-containing protein [Desulfomonilia bacterium]HPD22016.1 STAS domain-containing protein [Deltaproteobacteria bacterium]HPX19843.1 STAS domain-containing protein [Deltaproteobacteria bacterium]
MEIQKDSSGTLVLKGSLTVTHIESAHSQIEPLLDECIREIVLDLSKVDDIDISGLQLLYAIKKSAESEGVFRICAISPQVKESVLLSGFEAILKEAA